MQQSRKSMITACMVLVVLWATGTAQAATVHFGPDTAGAGVQSVSIEGAIAFDQYRTGANPGTLDSLVAYIQIVTADHKCKMALYDSTYATLLDTTVEVTVAVQAFGYVQFASVGHYALSPNTLYSIAVWAEATTGSANVRAQTETGNSYEYDLSRTYGAWPAPLVNDFGGSDKAHMMYGVYTESAPVTSQVIIIGGGQ